MAKIKDLPKIERPREKLVAKGAENLKDSELLAILLRTGKSGKNVIEVASQILSKYSKKRLLQNKQSVLLLSPQDVWEQLKDIRDNKKEHFVIFFLDVRNQEIKREVVSVGSLNANLVHPREVFEPAVRHLAAQVIIAHNHPAGDPSPSQEDSEITKQLVDAGKLLGIDISDHVIVSKANYFSFKEHKLI